MLKKLNAKDFRDVTGGDCDCICEQKSNPDAKLFIARVDNGHSCKDLCLRTLPRGTWDMDRCV